MKDSKYFKVNITKFIATFDSKFKRNKIWNYSICNSFIFKYIKYDKTPICNVARYYKYSNSSV
jgi:hypothetical protein